MKKLLVLLLVSLAFAAGTFTQTQFETETEAAGLEIIENWQLLAVMALIVSIILVAIAYAIGMGMEMPEIKAWAGNELMQVFANAVIIISLVVVIVFIDLFVSAMVMDSGLDIPGCADPTKSCLQDVSNAYLDDYIESAKSGAKTVLLNNVDAAAMANRRGGVYAITLFALQAGYTTTLAGHYVLDTDMYAILFEYYTNLLTSLESQKFFVNEICFKMGPVLLAIGVVARSFFFTRKLGGLLIAIAAGLMFFFPGMYIFDWMTLDMTMTGDLALEQGEESPCPAECSMAPPLAYIEGGEGLVSVREVYALFSSEDAGLAQGILNGTVESAVGSNGTADGKVVHSCYYGQDAECPSICRELPYPHTVPLCLNESAGTQEICAKVDEECKVKRLINTSAPTFNLDEYEKCPDSCKVVPPLKSDCDFDQCLESRFDCRVYKRTGDEPEWWPNPTQDVGKYKECKWAKNCPVSEVAEESCVYIIPDTGLCEDLCPDCEPYCRIEGADLSLLPDDCKTEDGTELLPQCLLCPDSCKVRIDDITELNPPSGSCDVCPAERRVIYSNLPDNYTTGNCSLEMCPKDYRVTLPRTACEMCLYIDDSYAYDPPIQTGCTDLCKPPDNVPVKESGSYTKIGEDGLVGKDEIKNVSKLMLPAYLLPMFNIVATLVFIKGFSTILGGDIEIPGISKVF